MKFDNIKKQIASLLKKSDSLVTFIEFGEISWYING